MIMIMVKTAGTILGSAFRFFCLGLYKLGKDEVDKMEYGKKNVQVKVKVKFHLEQARRPRGVVGV